MSTDLTYEDAPGGVLSEWHPALNGSLTPGQISLNSAKKIYWLCPVGHTWSSAARDRVRKTYLCPVCSGRRLIVGFNDLATTHPELAAEWSKNNELAASDVTPISGKEVLWVCKLGHEWEAAVKARVKGRKCDVCANRVILRGFNDLATTHPELAAEWSDKNELTPKEVTYGSVKKVIWVGACGHGWVASVNNRSAHNQGCPICAGRKPGSARVYNTGKLLSSGLPHLFEMLKTTDNPDVDLDKITVKSGVTLNWHCASGHSWSAMVSDVTRERKTGSQERCPVCRNRVVLEGFNDILTTNPEIKDRWDYTKNEQGPENYTRGMRKDVFWLCEKGHKWESPVSTLGKCPTCAGYYVDNGVNDFATRFPGLLKEWDYVKNDVDPHSIGVSSKDRFYWVCSKNKNHTWRTDVDSRVFAEHGCPKCSNRISKAEQDLFLYLKEALPDTEILQSVRDVIKGELDIHLPEKNLAVEFNGLYWHSEAMGKDKWYHYNKYKVCKDLGIQLIQIWEDDWSANGEFIKSSLLHKLKASGSERIGARKLNAVKVDYATASDFLNLNHVQGSAAGSKYYGLTSPEKGLVAVLVIKAASSTGDEGKWLIERYATSVGIPGGFTKLMKQAERDIPGIKKWVTFSDNTVSDGGLYENNGFTLDENLAPDYMYISEGKRNHKFGYRIKRFRNDPNLNYEEGMTEKELAALNGIPRIWDAGKVRWLKETGLK